jgi:hypothetical protein
MRHSRKFYATNRKKLANFRAAKERKRIARHLREEPMPDMSHCCPMPKRKPSGFRVTIECLDDGERVSFTSSRLPFGLSVSPTLAGKKVAAVLQNYQAA